MYHIVVFEDTNEVEVTAATWAEDGSCMRPSAAAGWMPDGVRAIFTSSKNCHVSVVSTGTSTHITDLKPLLKNILINQEFMMNQIKIIHKEIKGLYTTSSDELLLKLFPLNNRQSVEDMEAELHENPELQDTALALRGGGSLSECVGRIMTALLTHSLSKQINWRGVNGKMGFQHLQIKKLVTVAVRRNQLTSMETDRDIDLAITKWLQNASDRNGGRQERRKRSVQQRGGDC
uniref:DUF4806 domain-containing protein n=1 Tax=Poecilia mexicana TaxID=48701 RepID=A0A3B3YED7_9TELE